MALAIYNGFSGEKRMAVHQLQLRQVAAKELPAPVACIVCGQHEGALDMHLENYDTPADYFPTCLTCHLMLHSRYHRKQRFLHYRSRVAGGWCGPALPRKGGFNEFNRIYAAGHWPEGTTHDAARGRTFLDLLPLERTVPPRFLTPSDYVVQMLAHPDALVAA